MADETKTVQENVAAIDLNAKSEDFVDPWNVESTSDAGIDYEKLIRKLFVWIAAHSYTNSNI